MSIFEIFLIGAALSMDAFAVCLSSAMVYNNMTRSWKIVMPAAFGIMQGLMPVLGYFFGSLFADFINKWSGPVVLLILGIIGINMIREGLAGEENRPPHRLTLRVLMFQAVATSIDAFAVGVSFAATGAPIMKAAPLIAATTFILSLIAVFIGTRLGEKLGDRAEIVGGLVLIGIGIKAMFF